MEKLNKIDDFLRQLSAPFSHLASKAKQFLKESSSDIRDDGTIMIGHSPWIAPFAYTFWFFPPVIEQSFEKYEEIHDFKIPDGLKPLLLKINGCHAFNLSIYGLTPSMLLDPPQMDRSQLNCIDISSSNMNVTLPDMLPDGVCFGSRDYSYDMLLNYWLSMDYRISAVTDEGNLISTWSDWDSFFRSELQAAENDYPQNNDVN